MVGWLYPTSVGRHGDPPADPWPFEMPLLPLSAFDMFRLKNAYEAIEIFGELGAAKSTGSLALFLICYLLIGMGGLICCVKPGDRELVEQYAELTRREKSLVIVSPANGWRCNLIHYALHKPGALGSRVEAIVSLLMTIVEAAERGSRNNMAEQKFFEAAHRQILRNGTEVCIAARGEVTMPLLHEVITSAPRTPGEVHSRSWQESSRCYQLIEEGERRPKTASAQRDFELAARYLLRELPDMPSDTRGSVMATYSVMADVLLRGHMADLFNGDTNFIPEITFDGAIIVLDLATKVYGQAGIYVQTAFTYLWQLAVEQRSVKENPRPVFWIVDEAHELVNDYTPRFLATARSARAASILCTQNRPGYLAAMGGEAGRHRVDALLAAMATKIFHANGDPETNRWASEILSDEVQTRLNFHAGREESGRGGGGESVGRKVLPSAFTTLKKGGEANGFLTEAIVFQTGASFLANNGEPWLRTTFRQQIPGVTIHPRPKTQP